MFCDLLFGLVGVIIATSIIYLKKNLYTKFQNTLDSNQSKILKDLIKERKYIFIASIISSIIINKISKVCILAISKALCACIDMSCICLLAPVWTDAWVGTVGYVESLQGV